MARSSKMKRFNLNMRSVKAALIVAALIIAALSLVVSNILIKDLTREETAKMEVWAEAMRSLTRADENTDLNLVLRVLNGNNTIPVIVLDGQGRVLAARNIGIPQDSLESVLSDVQSKSYKTITKDLLLRADKMKSSGLCMEMKLSDDNVADNKIEICYEPSLMLKRLATYPYVQLGVVALFIVVAILALLSSKRAEQNKVWVGLSRETAHQLGTPISSLMAGSIILRESYPDDPLIPEMYKDIQRLQLIAERFSKIGSAPEMTRENLNEVILRVLGYIGKRTSQKVKLQTSFSASVMYAKINAPLFEWVIENLCKNAIDAMSGVGEIDIVVTERDKRITILVSDTGKGIAKRNFKNVFKPGFTTKRRGWGLGLSLAKRIIEEYHRGKIFVKSSELGQGTTFCIQLIDRS